MKHIEQRPFTDSQLGDSVRYFRERAEHFGRSNCPKARATALELAAEYEAALDRRTEARKSVNTRSAIFSTQGQS